MGSYACTNLSQDAWNGAWYGFGSSARDAGFGISASTGKKQYYTTVIRFKTPSFPGTSNSVTITYSAKEKLVKTNGDVTLRWALCEQDSDGECTSYRDKYWGIGTAVSSHTSQVATGETTHTSGTSSYKTWTLTINSAALKPSKFYYLFLWAKNDSSGYASLMTVNSPSNHSATVTTSDDMIWMKHGGSWKRAYVWIRVSGQWKKAIPWIRSGGSWKHLC